ncbi:hypothetical protein N7486_006076 [Penicillium sp. IBT 16267x]|nr:hypothetical protein N7486_006076 [Penicillium sp. IBT 16267x]
MEPVICGGNARWSICMTLQCALRSLTGAKEARETDSIPRRLLLDVNTMDMNPSKQPWNFSSEAAIGISRATIPAWSTTIAVTLDVQPRMVHFPGTYLVGTSFLISVRAMPTTEGQGAGPARIEKRAQTRHVRSCMEPKESVFQSGYNLLHCNDTRLGRSLIAR